MRLIDADALHEALMTKQKWVVRCGDKHNEGYTYDQVHFAIDEAPTIEAVSVVHGKWINKTIPVSMANPYGGIIVGIACSVCGYDGENEQLGKISNRIIERFNFCPNCGAKMKGADDETD